VPTGAGADPEPDDAAADDDDVRSLRRDLAQAAVVVQRAVPDHALGSGDLAWLGACCEEKLLPGVVLAGVVRRRLCSEIERDDAATRAELNAFCRLAPALLFGRGLPQAL